MTRNHLSCHLHKNADHPTLFSSTRKGESPSAGPLDEPVNHLRDGDRAALIKQLYASSNRSIIYTCIALRLTNVLYGLSFFPYPFN